MLSFSLLEGAHAERRGALLGDVVVSLDTAAVQARRARRTLDDEVLRLLIHGTLHLLGHDHERDDEARAHARGGAPRVAGAAGVSARERARSGAARPRAALFAGVPAPDRGARRRPGLAVRVDRARAVRSFALRGLAPRRAALWGFAIQLGSPTRRSCTGSTS